MIIPPALGVIFFTLVAVLSLEGIARISPYLIWPLFFVFAAVAVLQGAALRYMPNDLTWVIAVSIGFLVFFAIAAFAILGFSTGAIACVLLGVAIALFLKRHIRSVLEGTVHVMVLFGRYNRTLMPGIHFYFPGERPLAILRTSEVFYTTPRQRVLASFGAEIELAATISYRLVPEEAHRAVLLVDDWERRLHALLETTVQDVVNELTPDDFVKTTTTDTQMTASGAWPTRLDRINSRLYIKVQYQAANWGVQVNWVKVHDITISLPAPAGVEVQGAALGGAGGARVAGSVKYRSSAPVVDELANPRATGEPSRMAQATATSSGATPIGDEPTSLQALGEAYNAVRDRRITDPTTIREIANAFERLAVNRQLDQTLPFDPREVAWNLRRYATMLQQRARQEERPSPDVTVEASGGTTADDSTAAQAPTGADSIAANKPAESPAASQDSVSDVGMDSAAARDDAGVDNARESAAEMEEGDIAD